MKIDLRSDTITKPTPAMLEAMMQAEVGDDVYEEDLTVNALQEKVADMLGMEAALFCPSGTMTNQIGIKLLTQPQDEVICYKASHIYKYEGGGLAYNAQISAKLVDSHQGKLGVNHIVDNINPEDIHFPKTRLIALENSVNRGGGAFYTLEEIKEISAFAKEKSLKMHLDGARLWNAALAAGVDLKEYGKYFDTISVCLSKGLGCPVGSLILMKKENLFYAKRLRKVMGGAMRQAGFLAAAGIFALDNHLERLQEDHQRAKEIAQVFEKTSFAKSMMPVVTNILIMELTDESKTNRFYEYLTENQILIGKVSPTQIRMVTHLDFDDKQLEHLKNVIQKFS